MIPKIIHVSWKDKNVLNDDSELIQRGLRKLVELNPDWKLQISDDSEVEEYLQKRLHETDYNLIKDRHIVEKLDVWRLFKMFYEGGIYTDIDRLVDTPIDEVLPEYAKCVLPTCLDFDFSHDIMISEPLNPIYSAALMMNLKRRRQGHSNIYYLGAQTYMNAITFSMVGEEINSGPDVEIIDNLRQILSESGFMYTFREHPPIRSIFYRHGELSLEEIEKMKRDFYAKHNMKHWSGQW